MDNIKRPFLFLPIFIVLLCAVLTGCTKREAAAEEDDSVITIGMCFDDFVTDRWRRDREIFVSTAKSLGAKVNVQSASGDLDRQKEQIEYFIEKRVDVIAIVCIDSNSLSEQIQKAKNAGIKVIAYDRLICASDADLYISFDNVRVGQLMAEALASDDSVKRVLMLCGSPTDNNVFQVEDGFRPVIDRKGIRVVDTAYMEGWNGQKAADYVTTNPDVMARIDAIMCGNDDIASNVIRALSIERLAGEIKVVGQDADLAACQHIAQGTQEMTVYKPVEKLAAKAAECAVRLARGESIDEAGRIYDGKYDIPYIAFDIKGVTKDTLDEVIIESGYHSRGDVYMNVSGK